MATSIFGARSGTLFSDQGGEGPVDTGDTGLARMVRVKGPAAAAAAGAPPILDLNGEGEGTSETLAYTENEAPRPITPSATIGDADSANFNGGVLTLAFTANGTDDDRLTVLDQGSGQGLYFVSENMIYFDFGVGTDGGGDPNHDLRVIGSYTGGTSGSDPLAIALSSEATPALTQGLLRLIAYYNVSDAPAAGSRTVTYTLSDESGNGSSPATATIDVAALDDSPVAYDDSFQTGDNVAIADNVFDDHGNGADYDPDGGGSPTVIAVNGSGEDVGVQISLKSGATLTLNQDGSFAYDPNGRFNSLVPVESGAANYSDTDTFTYTISGGASATVTIGINGVVSPGDIYKGDDGDNAITGTAASDYFLVDQGGNDVLNGLGGSDVFLFGSTLTSADSVNGGAGTDQIAIQGDYSGGVTLGAGILSVESLAILPGSDTRFGDAGTNLYDYRLTTVDANVAAGATMVVDANRLQAGEDFTFNGSAETDGAFFIFGGQGVDTLTGGAGNDVFLFGEAGRWGSSDSIDGGRGGIDQLALRGNYTISFGATQLIGIESIGLVSAFDTRFGELGGEYDYNLTVGDNNLAARQTMTVDASTLRSEESLAFDGQLETDGAFRLFGGGGNDVLVGSQNGDILSGGLRGDTLYGQGGNDIFLYRSLADSNSTERDGIQDFNSGDLIDLSRIDANALLDGDQAFNFIGSAAFSNAAGELRFENISLGGPIWLIQADVDGNGTSDFEVVLVISPPDPITAGDFIL